MTDWWRCWLMHRTDLLLLPDAVFCQFLGWSRSGTTLLGSLLNAHPSVLIAQEADVAALVAAGADRARIMQVLLAREADFAARGREWNGYDYTVAGPDEGTDRTPALRVIGDKKAAGTVEIEALYPGTLARVGDVMGLPLRLLCVTRDPFDTIATLSRHLSTDTPAWFSCRPDPLHAATDWYLLLATVTQRLVDSPPAPVHVTSLERLALDPRGELIKTLGFLGVDDVPADYLDRCAAIVRPQVRHTAESVEWPAEVQDRVERAIATLPLLADQSAGAPPW